MDAKLILKDTLRRATKLDAEEVRFVSGAGALMKANGRLQSIRVQPLSADAVRAFHEECLSQAGREDLQKLLSARYAVRFPGIGDFRCEFNSRGNARTLKLFREPEAMVMVAPTRKKTLPSLAAAVTPNNALQQTPRKRRR